jgi:type IV pilus assembly protein PilP
MTFISFMLTGCGKNEVQEVQHWLNKTKLETRPSILKLVGPKDFIPYTYDKKNELDPFNPAKLQTALAKMNPGSAHGIKPDLDRRREALESFPLDSLKMVGTLTHAANHYALLEADSKGVYQVKVGNYIGQNFGLITKVSDDSVEIREIFLDSGGDWAERTQKLELQEVKK